MAVPAMQEQQVLSKSAQRSSLNLRTFKIKSAAKQELQRATWSNKVAACRERRRRNIRAMPTL